jgi:hypothetical protein
MNKNNRESAFQTFVPLVSEHRLVYFTRDVLRKTIKLLKLIIIIIRKKERKKCRASTKEIYKLESTQLKTTRTHHSPT